MFREMRSTRRGFTLLEICLAISIALLLVLAAVPSVQSIMDDQRMRRTFDAFDGLVRDAQSHSVTERRAYVIAWDKSGVALLPMEPKNKDEAKGVARVDFGETQKLDIAFPAALVKSSIKAWTFWPTGTCEPAIVSSSDTSGKWTASYDPLTTRANYSTE
jgi:prepilin-type N-terminal cleavage/methylation domain-containing protein